MNPERLEVQSQSGELGIYNHAIVSSMNRLNFMAGDESDDHEKPKTKSCRRHIKRKSCNSSYGQDRQVSISNNALSLNGYADKAYDELG
mmetsp:Transcript_30612/g.46982  ORF Transcript_30612/g.46982 Transcript_30612/m.46982 type:complete len:89 (+) Transcript_30612:6107-6373(+)